RFCELAVEVVRAEARGIARAVLQEPAAEDVEEVRGRGIIGRPLVETRLWLRLRRLRECASLVHGCGEKPYVGAVAERPEEILHDNALLRRCPRRRDEPERDARAGRAARAHELPGFGEIRSGPGASGSGVHGVRTVRAVAAEVG